MPDDGVEEVREEFGCVGADAVDERRLPPSLERFAEYEEAGRTSEAAVVDDCAVRVDERLMGPGVMAAVPGCPDDGGELPGVERRRDPIDPRRCWTNGRVAGRIDGFDGAAHDLIMICF